MKLEHYPVEKLKKEIKEIIGKHIDLNQYQIFFFGSRVTGRGSERSDIDIGIEVVREVPAIAFMDIKEELEQLPILYKIDVVDFKNLSGEFYKVAKEKIEPIL